jgi:hypothetical protein
VLTFLANVAPDTKLKKSASEPGMEDKILQSNPLLEALGNAKTLRNSKSRVLNLYVLSRNCMWYIDCIQSYHSCSVLYSSILHLLTNILLCTSAPVTHR